jgi:hypothetical protein
VFPEAREGGYYFCPDSVKIGMTDNKVFRGQKDRSRIDVNDPIDVEYVHHQFPWLSHKEIRDIIKKYGPDRHAVQAVLEKGASGRENDG